MNKVNLSKLKEEIDSRKREKGQVPSHLGESHANGTPKDKFLNELLLSLNTGRDTASTKWIKSVDNIVSQKHDKSSKIHTSENISTKHHTLPKSQSPVDMSPERDEEMWNKFNRNKKQTLVEEMSSFTNNHQQIQQPTNNHNINEGALINSVKSVVNNYLNENFSGVVEDAIKSTILEMYASEKIREVLNENKGMIKSIVIEVIREIQEKNKTKKQ